MKKNLFFAFVFSLIFILVGCQEEVTTTNESKPVVINDDAEAPSITIDVINKLQNDWLLKINATNFTFTPGEAGTKEQSYNEGYAQLYVDGKAVNRLYGDYYNLGSLEAGSHKIKVTLNAHNGGELSKDGHVIEAVATVSVNDDKTGMHMHKPTIVTSEQPPTISVSADDQGANNWVVKLDTTNFEFMPEKVNSHIVSQNEGHAHIYVDGVKINRVYGTYYYLGHLEKGSHEIKVTLNANDHGELMLDGKPIQGTTTIEVK